MKIKTHLKLPTYIDFMAFLKMGKFIIANMTALEKKILS